MHRDIFIISFPSHSCFPHDEILDDTTKAPEKQDRLAKDTGAVLALSLSQDLSLHCHVSTYLEISSSNTGSACVHTCTGLAQQLQGKCSVDTVPLFRAEIVAKVEIA